MASWKHFVILSIVCCINTQGLPVQDTNTAKDEISRSLQPPAKESAEDTYSSYFPLSHDTQEKQASEADGEGIPATDLIPPNVNAPELFSTTQDDHELSKELPVHQFLPLQNKPLAFFDPGFLTVKQSEKNVDKYSYYPYNPLSKQLDLPLPNAPIHSFAPPQVPSRELELPLYQAFLPFRPSPQVEQQKVVNQFVPPPSQSLELPYLTQPVPFYSGKDELMKPKKHYTKTYPKKYNPNIDEPQYKKPGRKIPVIEVEEYEGDTQVNFKKPEKFLNNARQNGEEGGNLDSYLKEKEIQNTRAKFEEAQKKQMLKKESEERQKMIDATRARAAVSDSEPITSETEFNSFGVGTSYAAEPQEAGSRVSHDGGDGERTEFQMHGQEGPHSYKFGYDTGKGKNRQFRYEERDKDGYVKGHYGFYDKHGKLQVINYDAHPHHGFHAEGAFGKV